MKSNSQFQTYLRRKNAFNIVNLILIFAMILTSLPVRAQATQPARQRQEQPCAIKVNDTGTNQEVYLPIILDQAGQFVAAQLQGTPQRTRQVPRVLNYEVGKVYTYDYEVEVLSKSYQRTVEGTGETGSNKTVIQAKAEVTIESQNDDGSFSGNIVLNDPFVCSTDGENESVADNAEFSSELQKPLRFTQAANGVITGVQIPEGSNVTATNMQKGIINALQMTFQEGDTYTVQEVGGQGTYNVTYELSEGDSNLQIKKTYNQDSFEKSNRQGDETSSLEMTTSFQAVLDTSKGILTQVEGNELIQTGDGIEDPDGSDQGFEGATAWTTIATVNKLNFKSMGDAPAVQAAMADLVYQEDDLGADFEEEDGEPLFLADIDVENIDLNAEVEALTDDPDNMNLFLRVLALISSDPGTDVLDVIKGKLTENATDDKVSSLLIDLLVETGTPYAQEILSGILGNQDVQAADLSATMSITAEEHALIGLVLIDSPTMTTVNTVQALGSKEGSDLQETAISVLGAAIDKLATNGDEDTSSSLTEELVAGLSNANNAEAVELYLGALGNAGQAGTLDKITQYMTNTLTLTDGTALTETTGIQFAALSAVRNIPGTEAEDILVAALGDSDQQIGTRVAAFDYLLERPDLSELGLAALNANASLGSFGIASLPPPGVFERPGGRDCEIREDDDIRPEDCFQPPDDVDPPDSDDPPDEPTPNGLNIKYNWNKRYGNSRLGVEFPGVFIAQTPPHDKYGGLYLFAQQKADGLVWNKTINLIDGRLQFWRDSATTYTFGAYLDLLKYSIKKKYEKKFDCTWNHRDMLWEGSKEVSFSYSIPVVAIISVGVDIKLGVHARLDYELNADVCDPTNMTGSAAIIPSGHASAQADAYVSLLVVRGGVGVEAKILDTAFTLALTAEADAVNLTGRFCGSVSVSMRAISGRVYGFADRRHLSISWSGIRISWRRFWTGTIATFSSPKRTYPLWDRCWPN